MRLAQDKVQVTVDGGDGTVASFSSDEKSKKTEHLSAYLVLHEQDVAQFVRNTQSLNKLLKAHPEMAKEVQ